jgi:hypothetical protein
MLAPEWRPGQDPEPWGLLRDTFRHLCIDRNESFRGRNTQAIVVLCA